MPAASFYWSLGALGLGILDIMLNNNMNDRAAKWAAYYVGMEVLLRMTGGNIVWEAGKYGAALLLIVGLLSEKLVRPWPRKYVLYFSLLLPSLLVINFPDFRIGREEVSFNLSGPFLLTLSAIYFYKRKLSGYEVVAIFRSALFPLLAMIMYLIVVTPNLADIEFGTESNFQASGGFGPNQVSTVIGLAIFLLLVGLFLKAYLVKSFPVDLIILVIFIIRGLATFSRGGMIGAVIGGIILIGYTAIASKRSKAFVAIFSFLIFAGGLSLGVWNYVNDQTMGRLEYRYEGRNYITGKQKEITSGRTDIILNELGQFYANPVLGVGPGMGSLLVTNRAGRPAHSHMEYTRMLAEHGFFGLIALLIMIIAPVIFIFNLPTVHRPLPMAIFIFVLFTLSHSAMRLAVPGFFYGLCLIQPLVYKPRNNGT